MNKHLQQPDSLSAPTTGHHSEQSSGPGKKHPVHGPTTQSTFKTDPNLHSQQHSSEGAEAKKQHHSAHRNTSGGSHAQKAGRNSL
ncbi:unnamed protein product [Mortierella alpina]